ncbi:hypothetical protein GTY81_20175 [Streptomyces sp. SID8366]|uniref:hypothetical protein n=1 Tax=unclassified Streptomyces TaxID=2593676 RepID=UPI000DBA0376|nr:hypothetical protein [Streptomyces sp. PsTaAH-130]MYU06151.1 hypothetical protein [Streptomyces sp. SID8366]MYU61725.1 hypothetical protein [Streptomyces sp. SID69]RAJ64222.1 hypothetical protein K376_01319 [Streptomyces sp. PsTaAH-130]
MLVVGDFLGAHGAAGVRSVPVGEVAPGMAEIGAERRQILLGEVTQPRRCVLVLGGAESVVELRCRAEDFLDRVEDAVGQGQKEFL